MMGAGGEWGGDVLESPFPMLILVRNVPFQTAPVAHLVNGQDARKPRHHLPRAAPRDAGRDGDLCGRGPVASSQAPDDNGDPFGWGGSVDSGHLEGSKQMCYNRLVNMRYGLPRRIAPSGALCGLSPHENRSRQQLNTLPEWAGLLRTGANTTAVKVFSTVYHLVKEPCQTVNAPSPVPFLLPKGGDHVER